MSRDIFPLAGNESRLTRAGSASSATIPSLTFGIVLVRPKISFFSPSKLEPNKLEPNKLSLDSLLNSRKPNEIA